MSQGTLRPTASAMDPAPDRPARPRRRWRTSRWAYRVLVPGLIGFNAWWLVREARPVPDLRVIDRWIAQRRYDESDRALDESLRRSPHDGAARMAMARSLAARGDFLGCARQLHRVPRWWPSKSEALYLEGESFLSAARARDAESAWRACAADDPLHPGSPGHRRAAAENLIKLYAAQERWDEAKAVAWGLYDAARPAERPGILILRLRTEVRRIEPSTRARRLRRYAESDPEDWASRLGLARAELDLGHGDEAMRLFRDYLAARGDDVAAWCNWLGLLEHRGDLAGLADALARLPESADSDGRIRAFRGLVRRAEGDTAGALAAYRRASSLRPHDERIQYQLATVERQAGHRARAEEALARSRSLREARNQLLDALREYAEAAATGAPSGPEMAVATDRLATLCATLGLTREAKALLSLVPEPTDGVRLNPPSS